MPPQTTRSAGYCVFTTSRCRAVPMSVLMYCGKTWTRTQGGRIHYIRASAEASYVRAISLKLSSL